MDYFKSWRRKFGVLTLVLACVFALGWMRSWETTDSLTISCGPKTYLVLMSGKHWIGYVVIHAITSRPVGWESNRRGNPFDSISSDRPMPPLLPYAVIVLPLTALSAWLLLSKPQATKPKLKSL